jgi:hypothetical protein
MQQIIAKDLIFGALYTFLQFTGYRDLPITGNPELSYEPDMALCYTGR